MTDRQKTIMVVIIGIGLLVWMLIVGMLTYEPPQADCDRSLPATSTPSPTSPPLSGRTIGPQAMPVEVFRQMMIDFFDPEGRPSN